MEPIQVEIEAIRTQIEALKEERAILKVDPVLPSYNTPEAIVEAYRRHARETAQISAEVKGIDDAIAALEAKLKEIGRSQGLAQQLLHERTQHPLAEQVEEGKQRAQDRAERINELAEELKQEVQALKAIADEISPSYWQLYNRPFITGFSKISVPYVRSDSTVWMITNQVV
ncbi:MULTISPECIES: hypothetical protein [unclassified Coleofasciculus]|uniref:hypothetical protein n=1 Tax=Cyanophyceae TaxID=3028117 RepID=UPI001689F072|nr:MULTISPECIES: hypothetical protein [unclassified Coleofasciculus]MBD1839932.1 hypothetical protein [Coleofasciculus sp. FACHB-501]MBD1877399.1 hypothetical protein [Coleofasciculus sp. FACHB-T130]MBD1892738.1 hypothetical protein [Coleofasciculus sp. FACHB-SPT9]MBD1943443.1 hypothetical protein [Coleofasciculus sp. FACHB-712]MBD2084194.1 hypothetical protein [Coleofasciculus sp. FACHB-542]